MFSFIVSVLFLAVTIAFLGAWGMIKQQRKTQELLNQLYIKAEAKVIKELKSKEKLSIRQMEDIIQGTKASLFWSKNKVQVTDAKLVAKNLVKKMIESGKIIEEFNKGKKIYMLK